MIWSTEYTESTEVNQQEKAKVYGLLVFFRVFRGYGLAGFGFQLKSLWSE